MGEKTDKAAGRAKQAVGAVTGDEETKREGERQEDKGKLKGTLDSAVDKAQDVVEDLLGVALEQKRRDRKQQVNTHGRHEDHHELIPQPTMRDRRRAQNVTKLAGSGPQHQHSKQHRSIVAAAPDVGAVASNGAWAQEACLGPAGQPL
jgi:uncharacterized protein YjbJ (UPF0337 family)